MSRASRGSCPSFVRPSGPTAHAGPEETPRRRPAGRHLGGRCELPFLVSSVASRGRLPVLAESVLPRAARLLPVRQRAGHSGDHRRVPSISRVVREYADLRLPRTPHRRVPRGARRVHGPRAARRGRLRGVLPGGVLLERRADGADVRPHPGPLRGDADVRLLSRGPSRSRAPRMRRARGTHRGRTSALIRCGDPIEQRLQGSPLFRSREHRFCSGE